MPLDHYLVGLFGPRSDTSEGAVFYLVPPTEGNDM